MRTPLNLSEILSAKIRKWFFQKPSALIFYLGQAMSITSWLSQRYFSTHVANSTLSTLSGALPLPTKEVKAMTTLRSSSMERPITILKVSVLACKVPLMLFLLRSFWKHVGSLGCGPSLRGASPCGWSGGSRGRTSLLPEGASAQGD